MTPLKQEITRSFQTIAKYQRGDLVLIKTGREWFDQDGGILPQSLMLLAGASFGGKTTEMETLKKGIMDKNLNPRADNFVWMSNSYEMTNFMTTLRDLKKVLGKSHQEILEKEWTEEEKAKAEAYYEEKSDGRFYANHETLSAKDFLDKSEEFLKAHKDKDLAVIDIDHVALTKASQDGKKIAIDDLVEGINQLKENYKNSLFIIVSQLNRGILGRLKEKSNDSAIQRGDIYQSDSVFQTSDYVIGLQNASQLGIEEYRKVYPERYEHLEHRFTDPDSKGRVSLISEGCIFVEYMKNRLADFGYTDLFTIEISEPTAKKKRKIEEPKFAEVKEEVEKQLEEAFNPFENL